VTGWEDVVEELPTPVRAELVPVETATSEQRAMRVEESRGNGRFTNSWRWMRRGTWTIEWKIPGSAR